MGKIVVSDNVSLDGVVQDPAGDEGFRVGGWVGLLKDRPELNRLALDEASPFGGADGVAFPWLVVFVDDMSPNVDAAEALGMAGVVHVDTPTTLPRLEKLLGVPLR